MHLPSVAVTERAASICSVTWSDLLLFIKAGKQIGWKRANKSNPYPYCLPKISFYFYFFIFLYIHFLNGYFLNVWFYYCWPPSRPSVIDVLFVINFTAWGAHVSWLRLFFFFFFFIFPNTPRNDRTLFLQIFYGIVRNRNPPLSLLGLLGLCT